DIFSFGLVLYEMLTGKRAFDGSSPASVIAAILEREAPSVAAVAPAAVDRGLRRCLAKDPDLRWQSASDLKTVLEWIGGGRTGGGSAQGLLAGKGRGRTGWVFAAALGALLLAIVLRWPVPAVVDLTRFTIYPPPKATFSPPASATVGVPQFALSPDGRS